MEEFSVSGVVYEDDFQRYDTMYGTLSRDSSGEILRSVVKLEKKKAESIFINQIRTCRDCTIPVNFSALTGRTTAALYGGGIIHAEEVYYYFTGRVAITSKGVMPLI